MLEIRRRFGQPPAKRVVGSNPERQRRVADRPISGASTEIAAQRRFPAWSAPAGPVLLRKEAHHESRSAVAALRAAGGSHRALDRMQCAIARQGLYGVNLMPCRHRQKDQATIDRDVGAAVTVWPNHHHRAASAFAFGAALFRAGKAARAEVVEQVGVCGLAVHFDRFSVQTERKTRRVWQ